jgi:hypothetical protein
MKPEVSNPYSQMPSTGPSMNQLNRINLIMKSTMFWDVTPCILIDGY